MLLKMRYSGGTKIGVSSLLQMHWHNFEILKYYAGYPTFKGQVLNGDQLWDLIEGLGDNDLLYYTHLLTG